MIAIVQKSYKVIVYKKLKKKICFENEPIFDSDAKHGYHFLYFREKIKIFSGFGIYFSKLYKETGNRLQIDCGNQNG